MRIIVSQDRSRRRRDLSLATWFSIVVAVLAAHGCAMPTRFAQTASEPAVAGAPAPDAAVLPPEVIVPTAGAGPVEVMEPSVATAPAPAPVACPATLAE